MIEIAERPVVEVEAAEYHRLLGYPSGYEITGRAAELERQARDWYERHGRPWMSAGAAPEFALEGEAIAIGGERFRSPRLARILGDARAHAAVVAAVSAGPELEAESQRLWREDKPDEYFFLEIFGSAVVERLITMVGARLCGWAETQGMAVLPHYSPGYPEWDVAEQPRLVELLKSRGIADGLDVLASGALRPRKSLAAVFGLTRQTAGVRPLSEIAACSGCSYAPCQFRRAPYREARTSYQVNRRALARWSDEQLSLAFGDDGSVDAVFRYDGTTCTNLGQPLAFEYRVRLGRREEGFPVRAQECVPVDDGYVKMCRYLDGRESLMQAIANEKPLAGRPLGDVLAWARSSCAAGCYCDAESREHKWGLVLETIHYALARREGREA
jgi:hypothetical protein